jgi:hypothetical protein
MLNKKRVITLMLASFLGQLLLPMFWGFGLYQRRKGFPEIPC